MKRSNELRQSAASGEKFMNGTNDNERSEMNDVAPAAATCFHFTSITFPFNSSGVPHVSFYD